MTRCRRCRRCSAAATPLSWAITPTSSAAHECRLPGIPAPNRSGSCATSAQCRGSPAAASWHRAWRPKATTGSRSLLQNRRCSRGRRLSSESSSRPKRRRLSQRRRLQCACQRTPHCPSPRPVSTRPPPTSPRPACLQLAAICPVPTPPPPCVRAGRARDEGRGRDPDRPEARGRREARPGRGRDLRGREDARFVRPEAPGGLARPLTPTLTLTAYFPTHSYLPMPGTHYA